MEPIDYSVVAPDYYVKARDYFKQQGKPVEYKCKGQIGRVTINDFISCTDDEKAILQSLQSQSPGESLSYLLHAGGFEELAKEIEGEDGYILDSIDWNPVHTFQFSLLRFSKFTFKPKGEREVRFVCLDDEDYLSILTRRLMVQDYSFTMLFDEHTEIASKIIGQINSPHEYGGGMGDPYVIFMDEVEADAEAILGAPRFSMALYNNPSDEGENVYASIDKDILKVSKFTKSSYPVSTMDLAGIPCKPFHELYGTVDNEDLLVNLYSRFAGETAFESLKAFLGERKIPFILSEGGSLLK